MDSGLVYIWLAVVVFSLIAEFITMDVTSIWFAAGGSVSLIVSTQYSNFPIQVIIFVVVSLVLILTVRKWARSKLLSSDNKTNLDLLKEGDIKLITPITENSKGTVKFNGVIWNAESKTPIEAGVFVKVLEIRGTNLVVEKSNSDKKGE